jgi:DNA-binding FadR family transcriptional regulator
MSADSHRQTTLPVAIAEQLRRRIANGEFVAGDRLPGHRDLAQEYSVSVGSVREAISMLISAGLIETRHGRGTFVAAERSFAAGTAPFERKEVEELIEAREVLELQLVAMAAERASAAQIEQLRQRADRLRAAAEDPEAYPLADVDFHLALAEAAGNRFLLRAMNDIRALLHRDMSLSAEAGIRRFGDLHFSAESHRELVDAIEAGEAGKAQRILSEVMNRNHEFVLGLYAMAPPMRVTR